METIITVVTGICIIFFFGLRSYAESCLPWNHRLNLFLNGHPTKNRSQQNGYHDGVGGYGIGESCGGD